MSVFDPAGFIGAPGTLLANYSSASVRTPEERLAYLAEIGERKTDADLARVVVSSNDSIERKAYLRELLWRWRDFPEAERPWRSDPEHKPWWEDFSP